MTVPLNALTDTWNASGTVWQGIELDVTDTGSDPASVLFKLTRNSTNYFQIDRAGNITGNNFTSSQQGLVPSSGGGTTNFLRADGSWAAAGGAPGGSSGQIEYNNSGALGGLGYWNGSSQLSLGNSTTAQALRVYNTVDTLSSPTNYEVGVFDWTTTANTLTIGTTAGGTGANRTLTLQVGGSSTGSTININAGGNLLQLSNNSLYPGSAMDFGGWAGSNNNVRDYYVSKAGRYIVNDGGGTYGSFSWVQTANAGVMQINTGITRDNSGWLNWGGEDRVSSDFSVTSSTTLTAVTGLSAALQAGRTYLFQAELFVTCAAAGGVQAAMAATGGLTATAIQYTGYTIADNAIKGKANATALGTACGSTTTTETAGIVVRISGIITVNVAGNLIVQMAQNTSNGTATVAKRGSYLLVHDMP